MCQINPYSFENNQNHVLKIYRIIRAIDSHYGFHSSLYKGTSTNKEKYWQTLVHINQSTSMLSDNTNTRTLFGIFKTFNWMGIFSFRNKKKSTFLNQFTLIKISILDLNIIVLWMNTYSDVISLIFLCVNWTTNDTH